MKIYDKGIELNLTNKEEIYHLKVQYRVGDMYSPRLDDHEALALETQHFVDCISNGKKPLTGGREGIEVVKVLVAAPGVAEESRAAGGAVISRRL